MPGPVRDYAEFAKLGERGADFYEFYDLVPSGAKLKFNDVEELEDWKNLVNDRAAISNYAFGLAKGGHLEKLHMFYDISTREEDIIEAAKSGALQANNIYLYSEIGNIPSEKKPKLAKPFREQLETFFTLQLQNGVLNPVGELETKKLGGIALRQVVPLVEEINKQIKKIKLEGEYYPAGYEPENRKFHPIDLDSLQRPADWHKPYCAQKYRVLTEVKKYLLGESSIEQLQKVGQDNPLYDKGVGRSNTGKLLDKALKLRGGALSAAAKKAPAEELTLTFERNRKFGDDGSLIGDGGVVTSRAIIQDLLLGYIDKVRESGSYADGFGHFKGLQAANRRANALLAQGLWQRLENNENIEDVFKDINGQRKKLGGFTGFFSSLFVDHGINSRQLKRAIRSAENEIKGKPRLIR